MMSLNHLQRNETNVNSPSRRRRYWFEVSPPRLDKVVEDVVPIFSSIPSDFARGVDLDGHDLADTTALDDDYSGADTPIMTTAFFATLDISDDEWITDVCTGNDMGTCHRKAVNPRESDFQMWRNEEY